MRSSLLSFVCLLVPTSLALGQEPQLPIDQLHDYGSAIGHVHVGWESRYVLEGRDSLDGDSLFSNSLELAHGPLSGGVWYGFSPDQEYDELQLSIGASEAFGCFECYVGYTHLQFLSDDAYDNEVGVGATWGGLGYDLGLGLDGYHSFDAQGSFWEFQLTRESEVTEQLDWSSSAAFGVNQGYVADGHDGANHFALRTESSYSLATEISVSLHAGYTWALETDDSLAGDALLGDFFHAGIGVLVSF